jgi:hypothetical protein
MVFTEIWYWRILQKFVDTFQFWLESDSNGRFTLCVRNSHILERKMFRTLRKVNHTFYAQYNFRLSLTVYEIIKDKSNCMLFIIEVLSSYTPGGTEEDCE